MPSIEANARKMNELGGSKDLLVGERLEVGAEVVLMLPAALPIWTSLKVRMK